MTSRRIPFSGSGLDRAHVERRDPQWLNAQLEDERSRFLPVWNLEMLVRTEEPRKLAWARAPLARSASPESPPILLGLNDGVAHFAVDISNLADPVKELELGESAAFEDLRAMGSLISSGEAAIAAQARGLVEWHGRSGYCAACASKTIPEQGGSLRRCPDCAIEHFPRTDPVVIAAVVRGENCLLGRSPGWPEAMYSALAGFVEPGENLEEALRREVQEEAGIRVGAVHYVASQPWPFPCSLMIGCLAEAESEEIVVDEVELEAAQWFTREEVRAALEAPTDRLILPPPVAIAHHLVRRWALGEDETTPKATRSPSS